MECSALQVSTIPIRLLPGTPLSYFEMIEAKDRVEREPNNQLYW